MVLMHSLLLSEAVRVTILTTISFVVALLVTPLWYKFIIKYKFGKQLRNGAETPVFAELHKNKAGTPTSGGIIIWTTVIGMAIIFDVMRHIFGGGWNYFNFVDRAETYLPIAAFLIAALLGLLDDWLNVLKIGGAPGGGLKIRQKAIGTSNHRAHRRMVVLLPPWMERTHHPVRW